MRREEKRRRFHEALLNTLFPPPPRPQISQEEDEGKSVSTSREDFDVDLIPDDYGLHGSSTSTSDDDEGEHEATKMTRAQRKRIRKKQVKEELSRRSKIVGPLLPPSSSNGEDGDCRSCTDPVQTGSPGVRRNADDDHDAPSNDPGDSRPGGTNQSKLKRRRLAKRLARESLKSSNTENDVQDHNLEVP